MSWRHLKKEIDPHEILLVADAALGQEAVNVAKTFHEELRSGIILTKVMETLEVVQHFQ